jgi:uncharacterized protein YraI
MKLKVLLIGATSALAIVAIPQIASAAWGTVTGASALNLRTCASVNCARVAAMPYGAQVWIDGSSGGWYHVTYNGVSGYASGNYISTTTAMIPPPVQPPVYRAPPPPPPPIYGYYQRPWWDNRHHAWYDGRRWYFGGRWYDRPSGFSLGFGFGG